MWSERLRWKVPRGRVLPACWMGKDESQGQYGDMIRQIWAGKGKEQHKWDG
jgi:hypothetical protein